MATYAIGDIQGCYRTLRRLLARIGFEAGPDRLWLAGDLVNRGPASLDVLRWARDQGDSVRCVLGNHDLHLLARAHGVARARSRDTLDAVLAAPDRTALLDWLRSRPLLVQGERGGGEDGEDLQNHWMVHAGLPPAWSVEQARAAAQGAQAVLADEDGIGPLLAAWRRRGSGPPQLEAAATALRILTTIRAVDAQGDVVAGFHGPPEQCPAGSRPWFDLRPAPPEGEPGPVLVCGHWAAAGLRLRPGLVALDTGCVWGGKLTAVRLADRRVFQQSLVDDVKGT